MAKVGVITRRIRLGLAAFAAVAALGLLPSCGGRVSRGVPAPVRATPPSTSASTVSPLTTIQPRPRFSTPEPAVTLVATLRRPAPASMKPGGPPVSEVPATWYGYRSVLPVISTTPGWVLLREAQRPNGSSAWVPAADVTLSTDPYYVVVNLATTHLQLFYRGYPHLDVPVGVGTAATPTVTGHFFIAMKAPPPNPAYGPFLLVTSAHSDAITDWEGEGDAIIAIHGPIDGSADQLIGTTGAHLSNGCIRLHDADLAQLAGVPPGTPVDIVN